MYDIVVFGATGFTGRLAVKYIANQYGAKVKYAIAGRSQAKLETLRTEVGASCDIIVADSNDDEALMAMVKQTKVVCSCAGPFAKYGSKLVAACVEAGVDYTDITGEIPWVREMVAKHDDNARHSGARIVHLCGHDSVPWDLMTLMLAKKIKEQGGGELKRVDYWDDIKSEASGGTIETAFGIRFGGKPQQSAEVRALGYDPLLKTSRSTDMSKFAVSTQNVASVDFGTRGNPRTFFFMAGVNAATVKRSNALLGYGTKVVYCEGQSFAGKCGAVGNILYWAAYGALISIPPIRNFMREYVLPKPGEGPSEEAMKAGHLVVTGVASGTEGTTAKARIAFSVDPGYMDTARMAVEAALALSLDGDKLTNKCGGVLTPAACQGEVLLNRLVATGTTFAYE